MEDQLISTLQIVGGFLAISALFAWVVIMLSGESNKVIEISHDEAIEWFSKNEHEKYKITFYRESGNVHRSTVSSGGAEGALDCVDKTFKRAGIEDFGITYRLGQLDFFRKDGAGHGKTVGGALIETL